MRLAAALAVALAGAAAADPVPPAFPFGLGGSFRLTDQDGAMRGEADPQGRAQLLFFGYASCRQICSAALPAMAETADRLAAAGHAVVPVMITVDPEVDTAAAMAAALAVHHPDFIGLTGGQRALGRAYNAFGVEIEELFTDPETGPVYAHGSFIYLLDGAGAVLTVIPPILPPERMAEIAGVYLAE